jgi:hypothetical protein
MTWAGFAAFRVYGGWRADDFRVYAAEHAGMTLRGQSDDYFRDIGLFFSSDAFNREQQLLYRDRARLYTGLDAWEWENAAARETYLDLRRSSRRARARSVYLVGVAVFTRLISAVDATKAARGRNRPAAPESSLNFVVPPDGSVWVVARISL